jgi:nicotinate-nucleotide adenylyltransferase
LKDRAVSGVGLMGGTFNPIHLGHLMAAEAVAELLDLQRVLFIPNKIPPHRGGASLASQEHRFVMCVLATASNPRFEVSRVELDRDTVSYTVDTVRLLREGGQAGALYFITGADTLMKYVWKDLDGLLGNLAALVVVTRPGFEEAALRARMEGLGLKNAAKIRIIEIPGMEISATDIRARVAQGRSIRYMVTDATADYIEKYGLYRGADGGQAIE